MKRTSVGHMNCSVARALDVVGEWWTLLIVRNLMLGQRRFEELQSDLGIARNILSDRLTTLVEHGVVEKVRYMEHPERYEYVLTDKGRDLFGVITALMEWGDRWESPTGAPLMFRHSCGHVVPAGARCSECGEPLTVESVRATRGPGWQPAG